MGECANTTHRPPDGRGLSSSFIHRESNRCHHGQRSLFDCYGFAYRFVATSFPDIHADRGRTDVALLRLRGQKLGTHDSGIRSLRSPCGRDCLRQGRGVSYRSQMVLVLMLALPLDRLTCSCSPRQGARLTPVSQSVSQSVWWIQALLAEGSFPSKGPSDSCQSVGPEYVW